MDPITAKALLQRYLEGNASKEEIILIEQWYQDMADTGEFGWTEGEREGRVQAIEKRLLAQIGGRKVVPMRWIVSAAAVVLLVVAGAYLLFFERTSVVQPVAARYHNDVNPGRYGAVLTLAGGRTVLLNDSTPGVIGRQGGAMVTHDSGRLVYVAAGGEMVYNTLTTQKGNQYHLTLPDGTKVWLNASSSITFPSVFNGKQRQVSINGEAYFEVAKNEQQPFVVRQGDMNVEVLGTSFDVNGYGDEGSSKTTLLEGKVRVDGSVLAPGQQAVVGKGGGAVVKDADIDEVMAWKNGAFAFKDAGIEAIMQQVERWYDVEVVYDAKIKTHFVADIPRDVPLSQLLKLLEETDQVHFRIDGKKVTVTK